MTDAARTTLPRRARSLLAAGGLALLVGLLWLPFGFRVGPDGDVWNVHANPEQHPWFDPTSVRPFIFSAWRLASFLFPESFVGYNLLVATCVFAKGLALYLVLDRLRPERPAFAFLAAALLMVYPAGILTYRTNMVGYQLATLCYLAAVYLLLVYQERPSGWVLAGMYTAQAVGLGTVETVLPLSFFTPAVLFLREGRISRRLLRLSLLWLAIPTILMAGLAFALLTRASAAAYQSSRLNLPAGGLARALANSVVYVYRQHFWGGYREGLERLLGREAPAGHRLLALAAAGIVFAIGGILHRTSDRHAGEPRLAAGAASLLLLVVAVYVGYSAYFPTDLRFSDYRTFFFSSIAASVAVMTAIELARQAAKVRRGWTLLAPASAIVGIAMMYSLTIFEEWDAYSRDEQEIVAHIASRLRAVKSDTMILVVETKEGRFKHPFPVSSYQNAMRLIYRDKHIHVRLCYWNVKPWERERPSCEFKPEAIQIRNSAGLAREEWPYSRAIILRHERGGDLTLATSVPGPAPESDAYHPEFLFTDQGPVPGRVFTLLKYGPELVRTPGPDLRAPGGTTGEDRSSPRACGRDALRRPRAGPPWRGPAPPSV